MKILMFITVYLPSPIYGGPTTVAQQQVKELVKRGHEVTVITSNIYSFEPLRQIEEEITIMDDAKIMYFNATSIKSKFSLLRSKELIEWCREHVEQYDVVHIHFARELVGIQLANLCKSKKIPYFLQTHGMLNKQLGLRKFLDIVIVKKLLKSANGVFVLQEIEQDLIHNVDQDIKTILLPNGIEIGDNNLVPWDISNLSQKTILFLARLDPRKKVLDFIEMAKILTNKGILLNYRIVGPDGGDLKEAMQRVQQYGLGERLEFVGPVSKLDAYKEYANSSIYILPSVEEPFPMSVLEALSIGIPTIVTTSVHNKDLLDAYKCVAFAHPHPESLATVLESLLKNIDAIETLSQNGKKLINDELNINKVIHSLEQNYLSSAV